MVKRNNKQHLLRRPQPKKRNFQKKEETKLNEHEDTLQTKWNAGKKCCLK